MNAQNYKKSLKGGLNCLKFVGQMIPEMKKLLFLWLVFMTISPEIFAQNEPVSENPSLTRRVFPGFSGGWVMPLGKYFSADPSDKKSGYATPGWLARLDLDWFGRRKVGFATQYTFQQNAMDHPANLLHPNPSTGHLTGRWNNHYLMIGPVFTHETRRWIITGKVLGGFIISTGVLFDTPDPTDTTELTADNNLGAGFALGVMAGGGYRVSEKLSVIIMAGLTGGWPVRNRDYPSYFLYWRNYKDPITGVTTSEAVYSTPASFEIKKRVSTFYLSLGLMYRF